MLFADNRVTPLAGASADIDRNDTMGGCLLHGDRVVGWDWAEVQSQLPQSSLGD